MIDDPRNLDTTYKVQPEFEWTYPDSYKVTIYPPVFEGAEPVAAYTGTYARHLLPQWMIEGMQILDAPRQDVVVVPLGQKSGNTYWFWCQTWWDSYDKKS